MLWFKLPQKKYSWNIFLTLFPLQEFMLPGTLLSYHVISDPHNISNYTLCYFYRHTEPCILSPYTGTS